MVKSVCETAPKFLFWAPTCVPGFEFALWLASKKVLSICQSLSKGNPTRTSGNSMNLLEAPNKDLGAASPTLQNPRLNTSVTQAFVNSILYCKHSPNPTPSCLNVECAFTFLFYRVCPGHSHHLSRQAERRGRQKQRFWHGFVGDW